MLLPQQQFLTIEEFILHLKRRHFQKDDSNLRIQLLKKNYTEKTTKK